MTLRWMENIFNVFWLPVCPVLSAVTFDDVFIKKEIYIPILLSLKLSQTQQVAAGEAETEGIWLKELILMWRSTFIHPH